MYLQFCCLQQTLDIWQRANLGLIIYISFPHSVIYRSNVAMVEYFINHYLFPLTCIIKSCSHTKTKRTQIFKLTFCLHWCWNISSVQCTGNRSAASVALYLNLKFKGGPTHTRDHNQHIVSFKNWPSSSLDLKHHHCACNACCWNGYGSLPHFAECIQNTWMRP